MWQFLWQPHKIETIRSHTKEDEMTEDLRKLKEAEALAYFRAELVDISPES